MKKILTEQGMSTALKGLKERLQREITMTGDWNIIADKITLLSVMWLETKDGCSIMMLKGMYISMQHNQNLKNLEPNLLQSNFVKTQI